MRGHAPCDDTRRRRMRPAPAVTMRSEGRRAAHRSCTCEHQGSRAASGHRRQNGQWTAVAATGVPAFEAVLAAGATPRLAAPNARPVWTRLPFRGEVVRPPAGKPCSARRRRAYRRRFACATWRSTLAGKKKTTFAKLNREAKVREKRQARSIRKEQRQREREAGVHVEHEVEDLSHLDVDFVAGVEPDRTVKR